MKSTYHRLIKILSCSLTIAAVLLCCVCVPAQALSNIFYPKDWIDSIEYEGSFIFTRYCFKDAPYISAYNRVSGRTENSSQFVYLSDVYENYVFRIYPLGYPFAPGYDLWNGLIDIRDFKDKAEIDIYGDMAFDIQFAYVGQGDPADGDITVSTTCYVCFYDDEGVSVGYDSVELEFLELGITNKSSDSMSATINPGVDRFEVIIPSRADYMSVCYLMYFNPPVYPNSGLFIEHLTATCDGLYLRVNRNLIAEQSETLKAIDDKIADLNDKADTIISGSDEMQDQAQDAVSDAEDLGNRLDQAIEELEDLEDTSDQFASDTYKDFSSIATDLRSWLATRPWNDFISLVQPIMEFPAMVTILSMLVAFINISILFFGR